MPIHRNVDHTFFDTWSADMAYVLGFFAADGSMVRNNRGAHFIEFHVTDEQILLDIRYVLGSDHKISKRVRHSKWRVSYRLQIGSKHMFESLYNLGFKQDKSKRLVLPHVPDEYFGDYVRGYLDGDGCVYFKKHAAKDRSRKRWVFQLRFTSGSREYLQSLWDRLSKDITSGGYIQNKQRGFELVFSHRDGLAIYSLIYNNTVTKQIHLRRKKEKFDLAMRTLFGSYAQADVAQFG